MRKLITLGVLVAALSFAGTAFAETGNNETSRLIGRLSQATTQQVQASGSVSAFQSPADVR